ncbi:hypothetical protein [Streptomyces sp. CLCI03]
MSTPGMTARAAQTARQLLAKCEQFDFENATDLDLCRLIGSLQASLQILLLAISEPTDDKNGEAR